MGGLADRGSLYAPDLRGHDRSGRPGVYSFALMREDALGLMDVLGLDRVSLVGHSLAGVVAYLLAESGHVPHGLELGAVGPMPLRDDWGQRAAAGVRAQVGLGGERAARAAKALTSCITSTRRGRRGCATATRPDVLPVRPPLPWGRRRIGLRYPRWAHALRDRRGVAGHAGDGLEEEKALIHQLLPRDVQNSVEPAQQHLADRAHDGHGHGGRVDPGIVKPFPEERVHEAAHALQAQTSFACCEGSGTQGFREFDATLSRVLQGKPDDDVDHVSSPVAQRLVCADRLGASGDLFLVDVSHERCHEIVEG
ncbi:alpha/beta fold hydrolase [Streptomyces mirabilis]|uniref:alpha/beta fold hydrolase n=1 Tax=Streptomyces mirabilis TaxID=68239 RepID=UPI003F4D6913